MKFTTVQWNIGGGKLLRKGADPTLLNSYTVDGLHSIIDFLRAQDPDIITLQETHATEGYCQPQIIADALGYSGWVNDEWAESHVEAGQRLGQGIISRYPIKKHSFELFTNPHFQALWENGTIATSHDKGRSRCSVLLEGKTKLMVQTLHTVPFRRFNIDIASEPAKHVLVDMAERLITTQVGIIQSDFNIDTNSLRPLFPSLFSAGFKEVEQPEPTTPKGHRYDHILYLGVELISSQMFTDVLTDHYPLVNHFTLS
ncbi:MAG TPA: endonuclease/exonuclease/phosphatase family protein [Candidatus Saccharimonadales bacterium]|nr:endonuclease/exonuclease/phosphatase family protein [Candidatus Saccharimonadales bacterium]